MDIKDAKILWDKGGAVAVTRISSKETPAQSALSKSYGACNAEWVEATDEGRLKLMLWTFVEMVADDGVPPEAAHKAFLEIDQYREHFEE